MEHPAFEEAGTHQGIEIWTIDNFEPVAVPIDKHGKFYTGDAYIVLKTTGEVSLSYDVHFWLGEESSQDKRGAAAILTVVLDDKLGGRAVQSREVQYHETEEFLSYFKPAVRYLEGGTESGFNQVTTNAGAEKRLLKLTGCDNLRVNEVPAEAVSLSRSHCFILELEHDIFVLMSPDAKATQRRKIISVANHLRDQEHNGRATIEFIDEFSSEGDIAAFFEALGSGDPNSLADESSDDTQAHMHGCNTVLLYSVEGDPQDFELVDLEKPYHQAHLASDGIYILDTPSSGLYLWFGSDVEHEMKRVYNAYGQIYLDKKEYPSWVHVSKVSEGSETANFKHHFSTWDDTATQAERQLWDVCISIRGNVTFEKVPHFNQEDLSPDGAYVLETGAELFLWYGTFVPERYNVAQPNIIEKYLSSDGLGRTDVSTATVVQQGDEPDTFKDAFLAWDDDLFTKQVTYEDLRAEAKATNDK